MLMWKVRRDSSPARLVIWILRKMTVMPRIDIIDRCWSRTATRWQDKLDTRMLNMDKIFPVKSYIKSRVKFKIELF